MFDKSSFPFLFFTRDHHAIYLNLVNLNFVTPKEILHKFTAMLVCISVQILLPGDELTNLLTGSSFPFLFFTRDHHAIYLNLVNLNFVTPKEILHKFTAMLVCISVQILLPGDELDKSTNRISRVRYF